MENFSLEDFLIGLGIGLVLCLILYIQQMIKRDQLKKEIKDLKKHLHQKMELDAEAIDQRKKEMEMLKKENENLRISNQVLMQKPGRKEMITLQVYQKAIDSLSGSLIGFPPAWQKALQESQLEVKEIEEGKSFIRKILPSTFFGTSQAPEIDGDTE
ncbi:hypothetical protein V6R21_31405 [Limibacter armeniacum]|uniref:hypothetical protein n=1 Tax=Limibacter armeniacum TaxID=466084 RepID=UPI002FE60D1D